MSISDRPGTLLRRYYACLDSASLDDLDLLLAPDCDWWFPGVRLVGPTAVREAIGETIALGLSMHHTIDNLVEDGDVAFCEIVATNCLPGREYTVAGAVISEARNGRIVRLAAYPDATALHHLRAGLRERANALRTPE